jgi:hypothetical protein
MTTVLTDNDPMPFGKYKDTALINVPAWYLLWLYDDMIRVAPNKRSLAQKYLIAYIEDNKEVLEKQKKENF